MLYLNIQFNMLGKVGPEKSFFKFIVFYILFNQGRHKL